MTHLYDAFPQQALQHNELHYPIEDFDGYSFAPIERTNSFVCDDSTEGTEVWFTPVTDDSDVIDVVEGKSQSLPLPTSTKELDSSNERFVSQSMPTTPALSSTQTRPKLKLNLPFKIKGFKGTKFGRVTKTNISTESPVVLEPTNSEYIGMHTCNNSVTETEVTEFASNLTSKLVHEVYNVDDTFESYDEMYLNPIAHSDDRAVITPTCDGDVELVYDDGNPISGPSKKDELHFEEDCDVYFAGASLDTIQGACGELTSDMIRVKSSSKLSSPTSSMDTSRSPSSFSSSTTSLSTSDGILKPPKRATTGYDPFGVNTDFETGMPKRVHFFENIGDLEAVEIASVKHMISRESDSDDSTLSIEYMMQYCGCESRLYEDSSSTESENLFLPVNRKEYIK